MENKSRPSRRGVSRNESSPTAKTPLFSRPSRRGVSRNLLSIQITNKSKRRPSRRGVSRNILPREAVSVRAWSPLPQGRE